MMHEQELIDQLAELTGSLTPGVNVSPEDLKEVRRMLADFLVREGPAADVSARTEVGEEGHSRQAMCFNYYINK
jgi:hypothetical protein